MISKIYTEFECQNCGYILWSEDKEEIQQFSELYDNKSLKCPWCGSNSFIFRIKGNSGGSGMPPLFFFCLPCLLPLHGDDIMISDDERLKDSRMHLQHNIRQTFLLAFQQEIPRLGRRQYEVLKAIRDLNMHGIHPTDREIAKLLGYADPNKVRPRRHELMEYELIAEAGKKICSVSGKLAITWRISSRIMEKIDLIIRMREEVRE